MKASAEVLPRALREVDRLNEYPEKSGQHRLWSNPEKVRRTSGSGGMRYGGGGEQQLSTAVDRGREGILYRALVAPSQGDRVWMQLYLVSIFQWIDLSIIFKMSLKSSCWVPCSLRYEPFFVSGR